MYQGNATRQSNSASYGGSAFRGNFNGPSCGNSRGGRGHGSRKNLLPRSSNALHHLRGTSKIVSMPPHDYFNQSGIARPVDLSYGTQSEAGQVEKFADQSMQAQQYGTQQFEAQPTYFDSKVLQPIEEAASRMKHIVQEVKPEVAPLVRRNFTNISDSEDSGTATVKGTPATTMSDLVDQLGQITVSQIKLKFDPSTKVEFSTDGKHFYVMVAAPHPIKVQFAE